MKDKYQMDMFSKKSDLKILKITKEDVDIDTDNLNKFKEVLLKHETMYPGIDKWFETKVLPGIKSGERVSYIGFNNNEPIISAVVKKGLISKFCHLHIEEESRNKYLGDLFFSMMTLDVRNTANTVYFTLPESLWIKKRPFFESFGFNKVIKSETQYRKFEEELKSTTHFKILLNNVLQKIPKIINSLTSANDNIFNGILMSVKPEYLEKMKSGGKVLEIRRKFNSKWRGCRVTLYSTNPSKALYGYSTIENISKGNPEDIWGKYESDIGCSKEEFDNYTNSADQIYAIKLTGFQSYLNPLYIEQVSYLINKKLTPPQSYYSLEKNKSWSEAISIAELLHGRFQLYTSVINT